MSVQKKNNSLVRNFSPTNALFFYLGWACKQLSTFDSLLKSVGTGRSSLPAHFKRNLGSLDLQKAGPLLNWSAMVWNRRPSPGGKMSQLTLLWEYWTTRPPEIPSISNFPVVLKLLLVLDGDIRVHQLLDRIHSVSKILGWVEQKAFNSLS